MAAPSRILPGFGLTLGIGLLGLGLLVTAPLAALALYAAGLGWNELWEVVTRPMALSALRVSLSAAFAAAGVNTVFGTLLAWVLTRYRFAGKAFLDLLVDLPLALPSAVGGISLAAVFASAGWLGGSGDWGVLVGTVFVGLPFVTRSVQPVLEAWEPEAEEAARCLGAGPVQIWGRLMFPALLPAILSGFTLSLSRGLGEYGTVIFLSSNRPFESETATRYIYTKLDQYEIGAAAGLALVLLLLSFLLLLVFNALQSWGRRGESHA